MTKEEEIVINTKIAKLFGLHDFWIDSVSEHGRLRHMALHGMTNYTMEVKDYCGSSDGFNEIIGKLYANEVYVEMRYGYDVPGAYSRIVILDCTKSYVGRSECSLRESLAIAVVKMIDDESNKEYLESWK
jgi:hypothetical protein